MTRAGLACAAVLVCWTPAWGQHARAWLDPETIAFGQTADLVVEVELEGLRGGVQEPRLPALESARIVGRTRESRVSMAGASITRTAIYRYTILPTSPGTHRVDPVRVTAGDRVFATDPLRLLVLPSEAARLDREDPPPGGPPPIFAVASVDRGRAWVGQQVTLTFSFYHDPSYPLAESPDYDPPDAPGFWRMEIDKEPVLSLERLGGRSYHVQRFRYALFPLRAGDLEVGSASVRIVEPDRQRWWEPGRGRTIATEPLRVQVDPLPPAPEGFAGAVGTYEIEGAVRPLATTAGTPIELELTVRGSGNPNAIGPPVLPEWPDVDVRPPMTDARVEPAAAGVQGEKTFRFLLVPEAPGRLSLGNARLLYFDPDAGAYRADTLRLGEIVVAPAPPGGALAAKSDSARGPTLWPARLPVSRRSDAGLGLAGEPWAWAALASPWGAWLLAVGARSALRRRPREPARGAVARLVAVSRRVRSEGEAALSSAEEALDGAVSARFGAGVSARAPRERMRALAAAGATPEIVAAVEEARGAVAAARFAAGSTEDAARALERAADLLEPGRAASGGPAPMLLAPLTLLALAGVVGAQPPGTPAFAPTAVEARGAWQAANDAYRTGDFASANRLYPLILETWADPRLEANLAAGLWRSGLPGEAYAHYLRALALDPRAGAIRRDATRLRSELDNPPDARGSAARALGRTTLGELFVLLAVLDLAVFAAFLLSRRRTGMRPVLAALVALLALSACLAAAHAWTIERPLWGVAGERAAIRGAADSPEAAPPIAWLAAGSVVRILERGETDVRVRAPGTPAGWVARDGIVPLSSSAP